VEAVALWPVEVAAFSWAVEVAPLFWAVEAVATEAAAALEKAVRRARGQARAQVRVLVEVAAPGKVVRRGAEPLRTHP
jgi:hypothetical protein